MSHAMGLPQTLLVWFDRVQRDLPWRRTRDPYAIWLSEVMLQQTQVVTVIPYFERFLARFPTVEVLANAPLSEVLTAWSGLGYYSRARNLHQAAQELVVKHGGRLPSSVSELRELPGFGRYTAAAVASIAFGVRAALVDGNVARVLSRLFAIDDPKPEKKSWKIAEEICPAKRPGDFNQALMELGATVCTPAAPRCDICPVRRSCKALAQRRVDQLPHRKARARKKKLQVCMAVCRKGPSLLVMHRVDGGLFGGLWELPSAAPGSLLSVLGRTGSIGSLLGSVRRTLTHRELTFELWEAKSGSSLKIPAGYQALRWVTRAELPDLAISSAMRAVLEKLDFADRRPASTRGRGVPRDPDYPITSRAAAASRKRC